MYDKPLCNSLQIVHYLFSCTWPPALPAKFRFVLVHSFFLFIMDYGNTSAVQQNWNTKSYLSNHLVAKLYFNSSSILVVVNIYFKLTKNSAHQYRWAFLSSGSELLCLPSLVGRSVCLSVEKSVKKNVENFIYEVLWICMTD